jgi:hypothetical protein
VPLGGQAPYPTVPHGDTLNISKNISPIARMVSEMDHMLDTSLSFAPPGFTSDLDMASPHNAAASKKAPRQRVSLEHTVAYPYSEKRLVGLGIEPRE